MIRSFHSPTVARIPSCSRQLDIDPLSPTLLSMP
ncbi:hypothetical protein OROMI_006944 [Orobanche minor]